MEISENNILVFFDKRHITVYELPENMILTEDKKLEYKERYGFEIIKNEKGYSFSPIYLDQRTKIPYQIYSIIKEKIGDNKEEVVRRLNISKRELEQIIEGLPYK